MSRVRFVHVILPTLAAVLLVTAASQQQSQEKPKGKPVSAEQLGIEVVQSSAVWVEPGQISQFVDARCPDGKVAISGGFNTGTASELGVIVAMNLPNNIQDGRFPTKWTVKGINTATVKQPIKAYALCINRN